MLCVYTLIRGLIFFYALYIITIIKITYEWMKMFIGRN